MGLLIALGLEDSHNHSSTFWLPKPKDPSTYIFHTLAPTEGYSSLFKGQVCTIVVHGFFGKADAVVPYPLRIHVPSPKISMEAHKGPV